MKRPRIRTWLVSIFGAFVLLAIGILFWLWPRAPEIPAEVLFPPRVSAALRFKNFESAFNRHWTARGNKNADEAIEHLLDSAGVWEEWTEEFGEKEAKARLTAYRSAFFQLLGSETWLVFGDWDDGASGDQKIADLLFITRADSIFKTRVGPLADLMLSGRISEKLVWKGIKIRRYHDEDQTKAIALADVGGWICVSLRGENPAALRQAIDQYRAARNKTEQTASRGDRPNESELERDSALSGWVHPALLGDQHRRYASDSDIQKSSRQEETHKKKKKKKKHQEEDLWTLWSNRLEGVDSITLDQSGDSLLDLTLRIKGPRIEREENIFTRPDPVGVRAEDHPSTPSERLSPSILQMDFAFPFAAEGASLLGIDWRGLIEASRDFDWIRPNLASEVERRLNVADSGTTQPLHAGRIGWALYPTLAESVPVAAIWEDRPPEFRASSSPADAWRMNAPPAPPDFYSSYGVPSYTASTTSSAARVKRDFVDRLWQEGEAPPLGFASIHFDDLIESMDAFPAIVLKKKDQEKWIQYRAWAEGMRLAAGSAALRLDRRGDELILTLRTLTTKVEP